MNVRFKRGCCLKRSVPKREGVYWVFLLFSDNETERGSFEGETLPEEGIEILFRRGHELFGPGREEDEDRRLGMDLGDVFDLQGVGIDR